MCAPILASAQVVDPVISLRVAVAYLRYLVGEPLVLIQLSNR